VTLVGKGSNRLSEGSGFESVQPPYDVGRFIFFLSKSYFFMDYDVIGNLKLWT
jgi:hypothetical protein